MSNLECPACKQNIDGDSLYCDQCGAQIFICSVCGRAGKGKRCIFDGKEMVVPGGQTSATEHIDQPPSVQPPPVQAQPVQPQPAQVQPVQSQPVQPPPVQPPPVQSQPVQPPPVQPQPVQVQPVQSQPVQPPPPVQVQAVSPAPTAVKVKLTAQTHGIVIDISEGDVLGRTKGTFSAVLGRFAHISGTHCQIIKIGGAWNIMDLGSTNGTFLNGAKLNPNMAMPLTNGAKIKLADIEFLVSLEANESGTQRI